MIKLTAKMIKNNTNRIQAISVAAPATPDKPTTPAMIAITKNVMAQLSIMLPSSFKPDPAAYHNTHTDGFHILLSWASAEHIQDSPRLILEIKVNNPSRRLLYFSG
jgi:hypothetical protein